MKLNKFVLFITFVFISLASSASFAKHIRIEFSGVFSLCESSSCIGTSFDDLFGQKFSGVIEIPNAQTAGDPDRISTIFNQGLYAFNAPAFFSLTTGVPQFDLNNQNPVNVAVQRCDEIHCSYAANLVAISFFTGKNEYHLVLSAPNSLLESFSIPSMSIFRDFRSSSLAIMQNTPYVDVSSENLTLTSLEITEVDPQTDPEVGPEVDDDFLFVLLPSILSGINKRKHK